MSEHSEDGIGNVLLAGRQLRLGGDRSEPRHEVLPVDLVCRPIMHCAPKWGQTLKVQSMNIRSALSLLLPRAIAWAEREAQRVAMTGTPLTEIEQGWARTVGVSQPERIRTVLVDAVPSPDDPLLHAAVKQTGMLGPDTCGLTLGYAIFIHRGDESPRLLSHEMRHVYQYEQAGSIAAFLSVYLEQVLEFGYRSAPLEVDARAHEC